MIRKITTLEDLEALANKSAPTWEGLLLDGLEDQLKEIDPEDAVYCTGKTYNEVYGLTGNNAYPNDLSIVFLIKWGIPIMNWKFKYGCRWADDVKDNNLAREGFGDDEEE